MTWNYAEFSKEAKNAGGPEKFVDKTFNLGKDEGHKEMLPYIGGALAIGAIGSACIMKLIQYFKEKSDSPAELEAAKQEIIQGINEYNDSHPQENVIKDATEENS